MMYDPAPHALIDGKLEKTDKAALQKGREKTMAYQILRRHEVKNNAFDGGMHLRFDALISHDITYVGIIQTAKASGLKRFKLPYVLTNCHNSLCAVGGTINGDDHVFGLSAAKKYGGTYVPANQAVIHQYAREMLTGCGKMILGSDSHTRYGAYGTMGFGEGGPELVKQLLDQTYDIPLPEVTMVHVTGKLRPGVGPHDVALTLCRDTFGIVKNHILEFAGEGVASLSADERIGIDVMTTETSCLSSIWETDEVIRSFYKNHGREEDYSKLSPKDGAVYDHVVELDLSEIEPMIALPYHPSAAVSLRELKKDPHKYLDPIGLGKQVRNGKIFVDQGIIAGCAGGLFENIEAAAAILNCDTDGKTTVNGTCVSKEGKPADKADLADDARGRIFDLSVYPASTPIEQAIAKDGTLTALLEAGATIKPCFCGPCFGAGDVPANEGFSIRHTTRNFPNREGSKPGEGQKAYVALMDARSIAATAKMGGILTGADELPEVFAGKNEYQFNPAIYEKRVYNGFGNPKEEEALVLGPNITDWPKIEPLKEDLLVKLCAVIHDPVTTTDELIPSGETSSYRSNPLRLAEFTLSRREPEYVTRAKAVKNLSGKDLSVSDETTTIGSAIFARKPGDGSAREQAASCQRVLGGCCNFAFEYATKRYRSNCINWGMIPFTMDPQPAEKPEDAFPAKTGDMIFVPGIRTAVKEGKEEITGFINMDQNRPITLYMKGLTAAERQILLDGNLMNYYARRGNDHEHE